MKVIVTGASGFLGAHIARRLDSDATVVGTFCNDMPLGVLENGWFVKLDITEPEAIEDLFASESPDVVIHAAAVSGVSNCESNPNKAAAINVDATAAIAESATERGAYMIFLSTDMVFDGEEAPYCEDDKPKPMSVYGLTKSRAEACVPTDGLVLRLALVYGSSVQVERKPFFEESLRKIADGGESSFFRDEWRTPLYAVDLARLVAEVVRLAPRGIIHVGGPDRMTRYEMAVRACKALGLKSKLAKPVSRADIPGPLRQKDLSLDCDRLHTMFPDFQLTPYETAIIQSFRRLK